MVASTLLALTACLQKPVVEYGSAWKQSPATTNCAKYAGSLALLIAKYNGDRRKYTPKSPELKHFFGDINWITGPAPLITRLGQAGAPAHFLPTPINATLHRGDIILGTAGGVGHWLVVIKASTNAQGVATGKYYNPYSGGALIGKLPGTAAGRSLVRFNYEPSARSVTSL